MNVNQPLQNGKRPHDQSPITPGQNTQIQPSETQEKSLSTKEKIALFEKMSQTSGQHGTNVLDKEQTETLSSSIDSSSPQQIKTMAEKIDPPSGLEGQKDQSEVTDKQNVEQPILQTITPLTQEQLLKQVYDPKLPLGDRLSALSQIQSDDPDFKTNALKTIRNMTGSQFKEDLQINSTLHQQLKAQIIESEQDLVNSKKNPITGFKEQLQHIHEMDSQLTKTYTLLGQAIANGDQNEIARLNEQANNLKKLMRREIKKLPTGNDMTQHKVESLIEKQLKALELKDRQFKLDIFLNIKSISQAGVEFLASDTFVALNKSITDTIIESSIQSIKDKTGGSLVNEHYNKALSVLNSQGLDHIHTRTKMVHQLFQNGMANLNIFQDFISDHVRTLEQKPVDPSLFSKPHVLNSSMFKLFRQEMINSPVNALRNDVKMRELEAYLTKLGINTDALRNNKGELDIKLIGDLKEVFNESKSIAGLLSETQYKDYVKQLGEAGFDNTLFKDPNWDYPSTTVLNVFFEAVRTGDMDKIRKGYGMDLPQFKDRVEGLIDIAKAVREQGIEPKEGLFKIHAEILAHQNKTEILELLNSPQQLSFEALKNEHGHYDLTKLQQLVAAFETQNTTGITHDQGLLKIYQALPELYGKDIGKLKDILAKLPLSEDDIVKSLNTYDNIGKTLLIQVMEPVFELFEKDPSFKAYYELGNQLKLEGEKADLNASRRVPIFMGELGNLSKTFFDEYVALKNKNIDKEIKKNLAEQLLQTVGWSGAQLNPFQTFFHDYFIQDLGLS